jgi:hypothetical protein
MISSQDGTEDRRPLAFFLAAGRWRVDCSSAGADLSAGTVAGSGSGSGSGSGDGLAAAAGWGGAAAAAGAAGVALAAVGAADRPLTGSVDAAVTDSAAVVGSG